MLEFTNGLVPDLAMLSCYSREDAFHILVANLALDDPNASIRCCHWRRCLERLLCDDLTCFGLVRFVCCRVLLAIEYSGLC